MHKPDQSIAEQLARAEAIKLEMAGLLRQLEETATGKPVTQPGSWRHHTSGWTEKNPPKDSRSA